MSNQHTPVHDLPISSGFSIASGSIIVYCGRCGDFYPADSYWAALYLARIAKQLDREISRGYTTLERATEGLQRYVDIFTKQGLDVRLPTL